MIHALHINDHNLLVHGADVVVRSQGYAWLKDDSVLFDCNSDQAPVNSCRLAPQQINSRYWQQCEQSSIASNGAGMRHAADLIWRHLSELKNKHDLDQVVLVVPSHYQAANLKLLLGIAKSSGLRVVGLVNKAVAALREHPGAATNCTHIDVQLHQSVVTQVSVTEGLVKSASVEVVQSVGIQTMQDALLKAMQESFIQNDRFDPLHYAETEQQLFDQLDAVAKELQASAKAVVSVQYQDRLHRSSVDSKLWSATLAPLFNLLLAQSVANQAVFVDLNGAFDNCVLPELIGNNVSVISALPELDLESFTLSDPDDATFVYRTELARVSSKQASSKTSVSAAKQGKPSITHSKAQQPANQPVSVDASDTSATHLLQFGIAVAISQAELRTDSNQLTLHESSSGNALSLLQAGQVYVMNDESRRELQPNDRLGSQLADGVITVIRVV